MARKGVPQSLRTWFLIHFAVDYIAGIPLFIAPEWFLGLFGFGLVEPLTARIVAAAFFAIGGTSLLMHKKGKEVFQTMLNLKIIWSAFAMVAILITILQGAPASLWLFLGIFLVFFLVWFYYRSKL